MRKAIAGLAVSALMLPALAGSATADDGWTVEVRSANLLAKGAAVKVSFDVVCPTLPTFFSASADVTQRVQRGLIASGDVIIYNPPLICDGATANALTGIVYSDTGVAFKNGAKRDVIVAKGGADKIFGRGGNDLICAGDGNDRVVGNAGIDKLIGGRGADRLFGGAGPDRLFGGPGPDTIAGQPGNDVIDGGLGVDTCFQGLGSGPVVRCERPVAPAPPPPEPPTLVIAYSDVNGNHIWDDGDIMISKIVDTDLSGTVTEGDTIIMGRYPTSPTAVAFEEWRIRTHSVTGVSGLDATEVTVTSTSGGTHRWARNAAFDLYRESNGAVSWISDLVSMGTTDKVETNSASASQPSGEHFTEVDDLADNDFIEVELDYRLPD